MTQKRRRPVSVTLPFRRPDVSSTPPPSGASPWASQTPSTPPLPLPVPPNPIQAQAPVSTPRPTAAPTPIPPSPRSAQPSRELVELIWLDEAGMPSVRREPSFRRVLEQMRSEPPEGDEAVSYPGADAQQTEEQHEMSAILSRGSALSPSGAGDALELGVSRGRFIPPLVLVAGDLDFELDAVATLEATIGMATPFAAAEEVAQSIEVAGAFLDARGSGIDAVARNLTRSLRQAVARHHREISASFMDQEIRTALVQRRAYVERDVFGAPHICAAIGGLPVYVPASVASSLPMFPSFKARLVARLHLAIDGATSDKAALQALGLGRTVIVS